MISEVLVLFQEINYGRNFPEIPEIIYIYGTKGLHPMSFEGLHQIGTFDNHSFRIKLFPPHLYTCCKEKYLL